MAGTTNDGGAWEAGVAFLHDGKWHSIASLLAAMGKVVPPGVASRHPHISPEVPESSRVARGQSIIAQRRLTSALRRGRWVADRPLPLGKAVYRGEESCNIRDPQADSLAISVAIKKVGRSSRFLQDRPGLAGEIPWVAGRRIRRADLPKLAELCEGWVAAEKAGMEALFVHFRAATLGQRRDLLAFIQATTHPVEPR